MTTIEFDTLIESETIRLPKEAMRLKGAMAHIIVVVDAPKPEVELLALTPLFCGGATKEITREDAYERE